MEYYDYDSIGAVFGIIGFVLLIILTIYIIQTVAFWIVFKKAGKQGWEAIIPFYNNWILFEIAGLKWWWFVAMVVSSFLSSYIQILSLAMFFVLFNCYYNLSKKFNKGLGFAFLLTFLTPIGACILAFSKNCTYNKNVLVSENGVFKGENSENSNYQQQTNDTQNNVPTGNSFCGNCGTQLAPDAKFCPTCGRQNI